uniref:Desulfoferrodoxin ferrous iron-binding domain-containing protein n=1 Tax=Entomoneis paludosa TaxID=265537 RepID=A0A7S2YQW7_9STRA|mmetsp:Transcript_5837/g.12304  ORF Transcript_5837/g.12304 Transcript_5837/m.12304 type:complete len:400 (+) Transcript_5837:2-1201(+)
MDAVSAALYAPFLYMYYATSIRWVQREQKSAAEMAKDKPVSWTGTGRLLKWSVALHILSWYMQIHPGHKILEGASPAVLANVGGALTLAPLFAFYEGVWFVGLRPELHGKVQNLIEQYTEELCQQGAPMRVCEELAAQSVPSENRLTSPHSDHTEGGGMESLAALTSKWLHFFKEGLTTEMNTNGAKEKHVPTISISVEGKVEVKVPHVMQNDHFIEYIWLLNDETGEVVAANKFDAVENEQSAMISSSGFEPGTVLRAVSFCNLHGFWQSEIVKVPSTEKDEPLHSKLLQLMRDTQSQINSLGAAEKHIPLTEVSLTDEESDATRAVKVVIPHVMDDSHFIQYVWLQNVATNEIVSASETKAGEEPTLLTTNVAAGSTLKAYSFCNLHGIWTGDEFIA